MSEMQMAIGQLIWKLGCPSKYDGFRYLQDAIRIALESGDSMMCLRKFVFEELSTKYNTDVHNVERCIRHLIEKWWADCQCGYLFKKKPTNSELICFLVEYIRLGFCACKDCIAKGVLLCDCMKTKIDLSPSNVCDRLVRGQTITN